MMRLWPQRRWLQSLLAMLVVFAVPYLSSRLASPWRQVVTYSAQQEAPLPSKPTGQLRIVSYNIAHGRAMAGSNWDGGDRTVRRERLSAIGKLLLELDADVIVLNEVDFDSSWSNHVNQAALLAMLADYPYRVEQRNLDFRVLGWTWRFGNAVLSKYPIERAQVVNLPGYATWETALVGQKRALACDVKIGEQTVRVIAAHLSHRSEAIRVRSARKIIEVVRNASHPTVVLGDLNATPPGFPNSKSDAQDKNAIAVLDETDLFRRQHTNGLPAKDAFTFPADRPNQVIDWVFIPRQWRYDKYRVVDSTLSDHRPVVAVVSWGSAVPAEP